MANYKEQCPKCGGWVISEPNRGLLRDLVHDAPTIAFDNLPGGNALGKVFKEGTARFFKKDISNVNDDFEKIFYEDIQLVFNCPNPECEHSWKKTYKLEESEYKEFILEWQNKAKDLVPPKENLRRFIPFWKK